AHGVLAEPAIRCAAATNGPAGAMVLPDGTIVTGKTSLLLGASSSLILNALKKLAGIDDSKDIISPSAIEPICDLKIKHFNHHNPRLHSDEVLIALSISSITNKDAAKAMEQLDKLRNCDAHFSIISSQVDEKTYKRLGINVTSEPKFENKYEKKYSTQ
ncbi:MAG: DUF1846 family protein, partial [Clostridia bacterium]|nr:DUF1846 family protein [Clostridia bacterium]